MGNALTKREPAIKHELLNEHDDRYFNKIQARNSTDLPRHCWLSRKRQGKKNRLGSVSLTDPTTTQEREEESTLEPSQSMDATTTTTISILDHNTKRRRHSQKKVQGWKVRQRGDALQLRLAKHRYLQLAASGAMSPITLDSGAASRTLDLHDSPSNDELNMEFESTVSAGMVWDELSRKSKVTAIAMSRVGQPRIRDHHGQFPLLLAVGGEDGLVAVTEILDDRATDKAGQQTTGSSVDGFHRKLGESLEFPLQGRIRSMDFSPDSQLLIAGGDDCIAYILRITYSSTGAMENLQAMHQLERKDRIYAVNFSPNNDFLAVAGFDGKVAIAAFNIVEPPGLLPVVEINRSTLTYCMDWSPNGLFLAIGGSDKRCAIIDSSWQVVFETLPRQTAIQGVKWNPDGKLLAIGDREVTILEKESFAVKCEISNMNSEGTGSKYLVHSLCWSPDGGYLAIGGSDGCCLVVECNGYTLVHEVRRHGCISCLAWGQLRMSKTENRRYLAIGDETSIVALLKAGAEIDAATSESDDMSSAASGSYVSSVNDWVLRENAFRDVEDEKSEVTGPRKGEGNITSLAFSRSGKSKISSYLAYSADDCSLTILTTRDWRPVFVSLFYFVDEFIQFEAEISRKRNIYFKSIWSLRNRYARWHFQTQATIWLLEATKEYCMSSTFLADQWS